MHMIHKNCELVTISAFHFNLKFRQFQSISDSINLCAQLYVGVCKRMCAIRPTNREGEKTPKTHTCLHTQTVGQHTYIVHIAVVRSWKFSLEWINLKSFSIYVYVYVLNVTHNHYTASTLQIFQLNDKFETKSRNELLQHTRTPFLLHSLSRTNTYSFSSTHLFAPRDLIPIPQIRSHTNTECLKNVMQFNGNQFWRIASYSFSHTDTHICIIYIAI